ncbi:unnamed protein product [Notodromas monacha]|uniref:Uncharacterized protein n=1 Tax=Notodromas monacha TaxID=399045 RepID=A0A7R9GB58_9CRUS|nr:unnamed protein product [Notodromas monacha]CAG0914736.1 unnamed protein product [Notodromas monacha]
MNACMNEARLRWHGTFSAGFGGDGKTAQRVAAAWLCSPHHVAIVVHRQQTPTLATMSASSPKGTTNVSDRVIKEERKNERKKASKRGRHMLNVECPTGPGAVRRVPRDGLEDDDDDDD